MREVEQKMLQRLCVELPLRLAGDCWPGLAAHCMLNKVCFFCITVPRGPFQVRSAHLWLPCPTVIFPAAPEAETGDCN